MKRTCRACQGTGKWTKGPRPQTCLQCDGQGQQFIGMTFDEAIHLARLIMEVHGRWFLSGIIARDDQPFLEGEEEIPLFVVQIEQAMMLSATKPGMVRVTLESPEQFPPLPFMLPPAV